MNKVSRPPHTHTNQSVQSVMLDVIIALMPALAAGTLFFGQRAIMVTAVSVGTAVIAEHLCCKIAKQPSTVRDLSAVVTGAILAMSLPPNVPLWLPVWGAAFAIVIVKMCFGGLGQNFVNPAMAGRVFLLASFPKEMTAFTMPFAGKVNALTAATPLGEGEWNMAGMVAGNVPGCIGETSAIALVAGAVYLTARGVIRLRIPFAYLGTAAVAGAVFRENVMFHLFSGGMMLGAFYIATDYTTSPVTPMGQIVYGIGCGVLTMTIRLAGGYPEGVSFAVMMMNVMTGLIEKCTMPRRYGGRRDLKGRARKWKAE